MRSFQRIIKYLAMVLAIFLVIGIVGGIILGISFLVDYADGDSKLEYKIYEVKDDVLKIDIEVSGCSLEIKNGENFYIESNNEYIKYSIKNNELRIKEEKHLINNSNYKVIVIVPSYIEEASIESGAGIVKIDEMIVDRFELDLGSGKTIINNLTVLKECDIDSGVGELEIIDSLITNLDLDVGVGRVYINSLIVGSSEVDAGIGKLDLDLVGTEDDYKFNISKGIGEIKFYDENISNNLVVGTGDNFIKISGGIGSIEIKFSE